MKMFNNMHSQRSVAIAKQKTPENIQTLISYIPYVLFGVYILSTLLSTAVFAADLQEYFKAIFTVMGTVAAIVGFLFFGTGVMSYASAYNNENSPDMEKAQKRIATGIVLILLGIAVAGGGGFLVSLIPTDIGNFG